MIKVNGVKVGSHEVEWGFEMEGPNGPYVLDMQDEELARDYKSLVPSGRVLRRDVYITEWSDAT